MQICCAHRGNFCKWSDCDFLQIILFENIDAFFSSLLGLVSHSFGEGDSGEEISTRWLCLKEINHYKPAFHIYRAVLESFFYVHRATVDSFVIVSFFLEKHYIPHSAVSMTNMLRLCQIMPMFWSRWLLFCDKACTCNYTCTQRFLLLRSCAYRNSLGWLSGLNRDSKINVGLEPDLGLWFRARARFRLQNEALLQLCVGL